MKQEKAAQTTAPATFESVWASFAELRQLQKEFAAAAEVRFKEDRAHSKEIEEAALRRSQEDRARSKEIEEAALRRSQEDRAHSKEIEEAADKRLKKLEASLNKVNKMVGDTANNNGFFAEEHFFNELEASHRFGNIRYDFVLRNENRREGKLENEYDILMLNGSSVAIIEIKYRAHQNSLAALATKKVQDFRALHPDYAKHKIYLGIASLSFNKAVIAEARALGIGILKHKGNVIECDTDHIRAY